MYTLWACRRRGEVPVIAFTFLERWHRAGQRAGDVRCSPAKRLAGPGRGGRAGMKGDSEVLREPWQKKEKAMTQTARTCVSVARAAVRAPPVNRGRAGKAQKDAKEEEPQGCSSAELLLERGRITGGPPLKCIFGSPWAMLGPRVCVSNKLPDCTPIAGPWTKL